MKRYSQLIPLSREHNANLILAKQCSKLSIDEEPQKSLTLCNHITAQHGDELEHHFRIEETTIFAIASNMHVELKILCDQLYEQHDKLRIYLNAIKNHDTAVLNAFGTLLKTHIRLEERELFPKIETLFNNKQLNDILKQSA